MESSTQLRGCAEIAHDVRMVVKHTFLELAGDDEFGVRSAQNARLRSFTDSFREPRKFNDHVLQSDECASVASTGIDNEQAEEDDVFGNSQLNSFSSSIISWADACESDDDEEASVAWRPRHVQANNTVDDTGLMLSDDEKPTTPVQAPPGVWAQAQTQNFVPVCAASVPAMQQPKGPSHATARRRRARALKKRCGWQQREEGEQQPKAQCRMQNAAFMDDLDAEFDDERQLPESADAESPEFDAESWPMTHFLSGVHHASWQAQK